MSLFGLLNYEDYILRTIVSSTYARNALTVLLMYVITGIIRFHLSFLLCWLFTVDNVINLFIPVVINVILALLSNTLYQYVGTHRSSYEILVEYLIANYSRRNMIKWKRFLLLGVFTYILIVLSLIDIDNTFLLISTLQTVASFIICDLMEHRQYIYHKIDRFYNKPKVNRLSKDFSIINDYKIIPIDSIISQDPDTLVPQDNTTSPPLINIKSTSRNEIIRFTVPPRIIRETSNGRISPPIPEKPPTPPRISHPSTPPRVSCSPSSPRVSCSPTSPRVSYEVDP